MLRLVFLAFFGILSINPVIAQRSLNAHRVDVPIEIDGKLNESIWSEAQIADDFTTIYPVPGQKPLQDTKVRVLYDDNALYISAEMEEVARDSIMTELTQRDDLGNTDFFSVLLDTYGNGTDGLQFIVGATGVQFDAKKSNQGESDTNWDAIWFSDVCLNDNGWTCEIKLPYAAIRFPKGEEQEWIINFSRKQTRKNEEGVWNEIDPSINGIFNQSGTLTNLKDIKPPVRLQLLPYFSVYAQHHHDNNLDQTDTWGYSYNGGMDIKYGINDAFTLDMTLIPDFGQVQSDDQILNLSPFEIEFSENRAFFTEGVELFEKGDIFYTRRVGGPVAGLDDLADNLSPNQTLNSFEQQAQLLNATKISGRNKSGLGIGFFNAIEAPTHAVIANTETGETERVKTSPLTNYNVTVLDQNLKNNSFVSIINTNVWRKGAEFYDANVLGTEFDFKDKEQKFSIAGGAAFSVQSFNGGDNNTGYKYSLAAGKISGNFTYWLEYDELSPNFNPNDLGFLRRANEREVEMGVSYQIFKPFGKFNNAQISLEYSNSRIVEPDAFQRDNLGLELSVQTKKFWNYNMWFNIRGSSYNFYEPRVWGRYVETPGIMNTGIWLGTDSRKKFRMEMSSFIYNLKEENRWGYEFAIGPRYRVNNNFTLGFSSEYNTQFDDTGFVNLLDDDIIFGQRNRLTIENVFGAQYNFTERIGLEFRMRHYWIRGVYNSFHLLGPEGELLDTDYNEDHNFSFNQFNIDLNFNWRFAPGSDIFINWKNNISGNTNIDNAAYKNLNYLDGLNELSNYPQDNSISIRIVYFLDYLSLKKLG